MEVLTAGDIVRWEPEENVRVYGQVLVSPPRHEGGDPVDQELVMNVEEIFAMHRFWGYGDKFKGTVHLMSAHRCTYVDDEEMEAIVAESPGSYSERSLGGDYRGSNVGGEEDKLGPPGDGEVSPGDDQQDARLQPDG